MTYIPKNKVQTNLYTSGGEFVYKFKGTPYTGNYYKLYNGKYFTEKTPDDPNSKEIVIPADASFSPSTNQPLYAPLLPTPQDYKNGSFIRYFSLRLNQLLFVEISKATKDLFDKQDVSVPWKTNKTFSLIWELTGDINKVAQTNKNITELTEQKSRAYGLSVYLNENWTQYYKEKP
jgi:hypothetical protein